MGFCTASSDFHIDLLAAYADNQAPKPTLSFDGLFLQTNLAEKASLG